MATAAQIAANRENARHSTGPKSEAGKAAVAQNRLTHGLSSKNFALLPCEDAAAFEAVLAALEAEHAPATPTESFLVTEMARAQWKLQRVAHLEAAILTPANGTESDWSAVADCFRRDCSSDQALLKLNRYEATARRAWHQSLNQLLKLRAAVAKTAAQSASTRNRDIDAMIEAFCEPPAVVSFPSPEKPVNNSKPMPVHLQRELELHRRRDPLFDPDRDRSQMSGELQKWFSRG